jgi:GTP cyclohydrolase I
MMAARDLAPVAAATPAGTALQRPSRTEVEAAVRTLLAWTSDDPDRPGLERTPARVAASFEELFAGYRSDPVALLRHGLLPDAADGRLVVLREIRFTSMCEHHLLPFTGEVHLGFVARRRLVGLGAIVAAVEALARRLQIQERLTDEIAAALATALDPLEVVVTVEAQHQCLAARGPRAQAKLVTSRQLGAAGDRGLLPAVAFGTRAAPAPSGQRRVARHPTLSSEADLPWT